MKVFTSTTILLGAIAAMSLACSTGDIAEPGTGGDEHTMRTAQLIDRHGARRELAIHAVKELSDREQIYETTLDRRALRVVVEQPMDPHANHDHAHDETRAHDLVVSVFADSERLVRATIDRNALVTLEGPRETRHLGHADSLVLTDELASAFDEDALLLLDDRALSELFSERAAEASTLEEAGAGIRPLATGGTGGKQTLPVWRVDLQTLTSVQRQALYDGIVDAIRTETITVKVSEDSVVHWEDSSFRTMMPVSIVRAHYAIWHHNPIAPGGFLTRHRDYLAVMEGFLAKRNIELPLGRIPAYSPAARIPAPFDRVPVPKRNCFTGGRIDNDCDWFYSPFVSVNPRTSLPTQYTYPRVCSFASLDALTLSFEDWHDRVHSRIGGTMSTFDSPAAPIFWVWHGFVDAIYEAWNACGIAPQKM